MSDALSALLISDLKRNWERYTKKGFSQIDRIKLIIHDAKNFWMGGLIGQKQWGVLETISHFYKEEDEEKFLTLRDAIEILLNPGTAVQHMLQLDESDIAERSARNEKWNPKTKPLLPFKDWNDLWLKDFERPTLEEDSQ